MASGLQEEHAAFLTGYNEQVTQLKKGDSHVHFQDTASRSAIVRFYYKQRLFMGFCCVCCELLYLALYLLHFPQYQTWPLLPLRLPAGLHLNGVGPLHHPGSPHVLHPGCL